MADEAEQDRAIHGDQSSSLIGDVFGQLIGAAHAQDSWKDTLTFTLPPGDHTEIKLDMQEGDTAEFAWTAEGGRINFDLHAHGNGQSVDYEKGRGKTSGDGSFEASFAGEHGWFWRNRDKADVTITLQLKGTYRALIQSQ